MAVTTAAVVGIVSAGVTAGMSFSQASKQRKAMNRAEKDAEEAMQEARKKLEVNVFDELSIQKEPFELEREALLSQAKDATTQAIEADPRNLAATAGRIQMVQQKGQAAVRGAMGQQLQNLDMLSAQEDARLRDVNVQLDLEEVAGAQLAAANAQELRAQAMQQGFEGVQSMATQFAESVPLFSKTASVRQADKISNTLANDFGQSQEGIKQNLAKLGVVDGIDFGQVGNLNPLELQDFMGKVPASTLKKIRLGLPSTVQSFNPNPRQVNPIGLNIFSKPSILGR